MDARRDPIDRRAVRNLILLALAACGHPARSAAPATSVATMLAVHDVARSTAFYRDMLGFEVKFAKPELALLARDGMQLYLAAESPPTPDKPGVTLAPPPDPARPPVDLIFEVRDARRTYAELKARGVLFFSEPQAPPWGGLRCFARDPDGYLIEIEQPGS